MEQSNRDRQRELSYKIVGWSMLIFVAFVLFSSVVRFIFYQMQIHDDFEFEEKRRLYYAVYGFKLLINEVSVDDLMDFINELEEEEEYEACAGIRDAIDDYINKQIND